MPEDSIPAQPKFESGFDFDTKGDRNQVRTWQIRDASITSAKIGSAAIGSAQVGTLSFNQVSGGTATLGGTSNGDGVLTVNNAGGTEVVRLDNTGIYVNTGTIVGVVIGTSITTGGTSNAITLGTPNITGGTYASGVFSGTINSPYVGGTSKYPVAAGSAALSSEGQVAIQTYGTEPVFVIRSGSQNFYFTPAGTL